MTNAIARDYGRVKIDGARSGESALLRARLCLGVMAAGLIASGATCYWLPCELHLLARAFTAGPQAGIGVLAPMGAFIANMRDAVNLLAADYPQMFLGTDYLGFAHFLFGVLFIGAMRDPRRNLWVIDFGIIAAVAVIPCAFIFGAARGVPLIHSCIDASFGLGALPFMVLARMYAVDPHD